VLNSTLGGATFPAALSGEPVLTFGDIGLPHSYTYIGDVARGLATLGEHSDGDGRVWHLPTVPASTTRERLDLIADAAGRPLQIDNLDEPRPYGPFDATMLAEYAEMFYQHTTPVDMDSSAFGRPSAWPRRRWRRASPRPSTGTAGLCGPDGTWGKTPACTSGGRPSSPSA
jgi:nucleoside-diphosphate-sugar epimerase